MRNRFSCQMFAAVHLLASVALLSSVAVADDPLFSEIAMDSVFAKAAVASSDVAIRNTANDFDRITGPSSLTTALESAGFVAKQSQESVSIKVDNAGWNFPVAMTIDVEADRIECRMSLVRIDPSDISTQTILALMAANHDITNASFVFDEESKMIQLQTTFTNRNVTTKELKSQLSNLANVAITHSDTWAQLKVTPSADASKTVLTPPNGQASIVGKWAGSLPLKASIAVEFGSEGTFKMVHLVEKRASVSSGTLVQKDGQLTLSESGKADVKFQIASVTSTKMQLRIVDSSGKAGVSIKFSKANP